MAWHKNKVRGGVAWQEKMVKSVLAWHNIIVKSVVKLLKGSVAWQIILFRALH